MADSQIAQRKTNMAVYFRLATLLLISASSTSAFAEERPTLIPDNPWNVEAMNDVVPAGDVPPPVAATMPESNTSPSIARQISLSDRERKRLQELGAGVRSDLSEADFSLIEKSFSSNDIKDLQWTYLAVEKLCYSLKLNDRKEFDNTLRLVQSQLTQSYVSRLFPRALADAANANSDVGQAAGRAIGSLSQNTDLLTAKQVDQACDKAVANVRSASYERRRMGIILLGDLIRHFDVKNARENEAVDLLLAVVEDLQKSNRLKPEEWKTSLSETRCPAKRMFQEMAVRAFLDNCGHLTNVTHVTKAYALLTKGLNDQTFDLHAVSCMAALAEKCPFEERRKIAHLAIAGISDKSYWHDVGSGLRILRNYAADSLLLLAPVLTKDELRQSIAAIQSQHWSDEEKKVFENTKAALEKRLKEMQ